MSTEQIGMGLLVAALCAVGLWEDRWLLNNTRHGQRLVRWFGDLGGLRALRVLLVGGIIFGLLLAANIVHPIHWKR